MEETKTMTRGEMRAEYQREYHKNYVRVRGYQARPDKKIYYKTVIQPKARFDREVKRLMKISV
jgi:hypothetical protein